MLGCIRRLKTAVQKAPSYTRLEYMNAIANDESYSLGNSQEEKEFEEDLINSRKNGYSF